MTKKFDWDTKDHVARLVEDRILGGENFDARSMQDCGT